MVKTPLVIVGAYGMLGQDLEKEFAAEKPVLLDRDTMDITDINAVRSVLSKIKPGTVINAAAYNMVDDAEEEPGKTIAGKVNGEGPKNIAIVCAELNATFLHYSSDYVFDGTNQDGYAEDAQTGPQSAYASSKLQGEENVLAQMGKMYVVRTCKLFGQPAVSEGAKKSFVDVMLTLAETKDTLDIVDEEFASPTYTPDLAHQTRVLLEGDYKPGMYHITNSGGCTWFEFAQEIFNAAGVDITLNKVTSDAFPRPASRPKFSVLLNTKLPAMRSWQEAVREYIANR